MASESNDNAGKLQLDAEPEVITGRTNLSRVVCAAGARAAPRLSRPTVNNHDYWVVATLSFQPPYSAPRVVILFERLWGFCSAEFGPLPATRVRPSFDITLGSRAAPRADHHVLFQEIRIRYMCLGRLDVDSPPLMRDSPCRCPSRSWSIAKHLWKFGWSCVDTSSVFPLGPCLLPSCATLTALPRPI